MTSPHPAPSRIMGICVPKAGTHLLTDIFAAMGFRTLAQRKVEGRQIFEGCDFAPDESVYAYGHWRRNPGVPERLAHLQFRLLLLLRDPRDIWLSMADFLKGGQPRAAILGDPSLLNRSLPELRRMVIAGFQVPGFTCRPIRSHCEGWRKWQDHGAVVLRYEQIGHSVASGIHMKELLAVGVDPSAFLEAARATYRPPGPGPGAVRWRTEFDAELRGLWKEHATGVAASLGYEEL